MKNRIKVILFTVIMMAFSTATKAEEVQSQSVDTIAMLQQRLENLTLKFDTLTNALNKSDIKEETISASDTKIDLNFNFSDNKAAFFKAVDILAIGFSIVFVVMIIFIFVSKGIDKMFPLKKE